MSLLLQDKVYTIQSTTAKRGIYPLHSYKLGLYRLPIKLEDQYEIDSIVNGLKKTFVMDAFATAHRAQASTHGIAKYAKVACAGLFLLQNTRGVGNLIIALGSFFLLLCFLFYRLPMAEGGTFSGNCAVPNAARSASFASAA